MRNLGTEGWRQTGMIAGLGIIAAATMLLIGVMWTLGWGLFSNATAEFRGETAQRERVVADGDYRVGSYDHFFDLCAAIQGKESTIAELEAERERASARRVAQIDATLTALRASRKSSIRSYNADARKAATAGRFRDSSLPYQLDVEKEETSCAA